MTDINPRATKEATAAQQRIQRQVDAKPAPHRPNSGRKAMQAGARKYPVPPFPEQHQSKPGKENHIKPAPMYDAPYYLGSKKLDGKVALVTGGDSGIGRAVAILFAREGYDVAILYLAEDENAKQTQAAIESEGRRCILLKADVSDRASCRKAVKETVDRLGGLDVLVNNAGFGLMGAIEEVSLPEARNQFEVNVFGPLALIQAVLPAMRARKAGTIVNVTSVSGLATWQGTGVYCASKFALEAIGETLGDEVAPLGIKVMNVEPGGMRTDYASRSLARAEKKLADYHDTAHSSERILAGHAGHESGDPAKMAAHILAAVNSGTPPRNLLLGADAMHYATRRMGSLLAEIGNWAAVTVDTKFEK